jgi:hypothetical protein
LQSFSPQARTTAMPYDPRFGAYAQTPQQRERVFRQMLVVFPRLRTKVATCGRQLHARYVAGEITWADVRSALDEAEGRA